MKEIKIKEILGQEILSRENVRKINPFIIQEFQTLDFHEVTFVSRSAADEIFNLLNENIGLSISNLHPDVKVMMDVVKRGRQSNNRKFNNAKKSTTFFCENMEDVKKALLSREIIDTSI